MFFVISDAGVGTNATGSDPNDGDSNEGDSNDSNSTESGSVPRVFYPLNHLTQGRDLRGNGYDADFINTVIEDDYQESDFRAGGVLRLRDDDAYTEIDNSNHAFTFQVCNVQHCCT